MASLAESAAIGGVIHAGGVLRDSPILSQNVDSLRAVLASKAVGLRNLHEKVKNITYLIGKTGRTFFSFFSSSCQYFKLLFDFSFL